MSSIDSKTSILVTGAQGQLGQRLLERASTQGDMKATGVDRDEMDICDLVQIEAKLDQVSPDVVINAAAFTAVDLAETHAEQAHLVNAVGVGNLAAACASRGISMIHMSTDYVFDGAGSGRMTTDIRSRFFHQSIFAGIPVPQWRPVYGGGAD